jgi:hypothetical protein
VSAEFREVDPGLFRVHYRTGADLNPELQQPLVAAVEAASKNGPTAITFVLEAAIRSVELSVPTFWLGVTSRAELRLCAMAIVTTSAAVRTAAKGFDIANKVRRIPLEVATFEAEPNALRWVGEVMGRRR